MKNKTIIKTIKTMILEGLKKCTKEQNDFFKRIYSRKKSGKIETIVDSINPEQLENAFDIVERTINKNGKR